MIDLSSRVMCDYDIVRFIKEDDLQETLSVTQRDHEIQTYLGKDNDSKLWEVVIIKCEDNGNFVPEEDEKDIDFEEDSERAVFKFNNFEDAHEFLDKLSYRHQEYRVRPFLD